MIEDDAYKARMRRQAEAIKARAGRKYPPPPPRVEANPDVLHAKGSSVVVPSEELMTGRGLRRRLSVRWTVHTGTTSARHRRIYWFSSAGGPIYVTGFDRKGGGDRSGPERWVEIGSAPLGSDDPNIEDVARRMQAIADWAEEEAGER